jgi:hypothetical protein
MARIILRMSMRRHRLAGLQAPRISMSQHVGLT